MECQDWKLQSQGSFNRFGLFGRLPARTTLEAQDVVPWLFQDSAHTLVRVCGGVVSLNYTAQLYFYNNMWSALEKGTVQDKVATKEVKIDFSSIFWFSFYLRIQVFGFILSYYGMSPIVMRHRNCSDVYFIIRLTAIYFLETETMNPSRSTYKLS